MEFKPDIVERLDKLEQKFAVMGQDLNSYLDGLLYADYLTYWDYIHLDTLLTLQNPKTSFPDEKVFIAYHQITELYFNLSLHELNQIINNGRNVVQSGEDLGWNEKLDTKFFVERITRINRYFEALTTSFEIMVDGMEQQQFLRFRMALLPSSGFQSAQYRMIEICCTDFFNLIEKNQKENFSKNPTDKEIEKMYEHLYWKGGATELATEKKTLTLKQFEKKYTKELIELAQRVKHKNLSQLYQNLTESEKQNDKLRNALRQLDVNVNVNWPLSHYKSAVKYLQKSPDVLAATGGTNWQKYLPPRFQKRIFYPELWSDEEKNEWGKSWVNAMISNK